MRLPCAARRQLIICSGDIASCLATHAELCTKHRNPYDEYKSQVAYHESSPSMNAGLVRKSPYVAKSDGRTDCRGYSREFCGEYRPVIVFLMCCHIILIVGNLSSFLF